MSERIVGSADGRDYLDWRLGPGRTAEIVDVAVGTQRRRGRGRAMVAELLRRLAALRDADPTSSSPALVYAVTRMDNTIAHEFYESLGFRVVGRLHGFYRDGGPREPTNSHALVFALDL